MKTVIITGASSGIGKALIKALDSENYNLVLASRSAEKMEAIKESVSTSKCLIVPTDVRDYEQCEALVKQATAHFGTVDVLVNNAGLGYFDPLEEGKIEHWHTMVDTNVKGVLIQQGQERKLISSNILIEPSE